MLFKMFGEEEGKKIKIKLKNFSVMKKKNNSLTTYFIFKNRTHVQKLPFCVNIVDYACLKEKGFLFYASTYMYCSYALRPVKK